MRGDKALSLKTPGHLLINLLVMAALAGFSVPVIAGAPINPGGPFVPPGKDANRSAIMTFDEVEAELLSLERRSKGVMTMEIAGYSVEGRPLYVAKLGSGPERMWIQGRIHGDEPYGNDACLDIIKSLLASDRRILEEITFWIIPSYNPDGSESYTRRNANRVDLNRNWLPYGNGFSEPESKAFYWAWAEFKPHYAIDIHHQGTYFVEDENGNNTNQMTTFSIGITLWQQLLEPGIWNTSRRMGVAGYDALKKLGFCNPSRYPRVNIESAVLSSMMRGNPGPNGHDAGWKTAAIFFENRGGIGSKSRGYLIRQNLAAIHAIVEAVAYGELALVDENRWDEIPERGGVIRGTDKWPDEWAEPDPGVRDTGDDAGKFHFRIIAADDTGDENGPAGPAVSGAPIVPDEFALHQNIPNPFNPSTVIRYDVPGRGGDVTLRIYDVRGRLVRTLVNGAQTAGEKRATWDGRNDRGSRVATGVYFYRMTAAGFDMKRKMVLLQ